MASAQSLFLGRSDSPITMLHHIFGMHNVQGHNQPVLLHDFFSFQLFSSEDRDRENGADEEASLRRYARNFI
jgi:hypothetical protein